MPECFAIMPVSTPPDLANRYGGDLDHFTHVYDHLFKPAIAKAGFTALPPVTKGSEIIHADIVKKLETASIVLCDMSLANANVFFELGIRTALNRPVVLVRDEHLQKVPFDTALINHHSYSSSLSPWLLQAEIDALANHLLSSIQQGEGNSLWKYFGLTTKGTSAPSSSSDEKLDLILRAVLNDQDPRKQVPAIEYSDPLSASRRVADLSARIAGYVSAQIEIASIAPKSLRLDLGGFALSDDDIKLIKTIGRHLGVSVEVTGNAEFEEQG
jgi:hypothetical protein